MVFPMHFQSLLRATVIVATYLTLTVSRNEHFAFNHPLYWQWLAAYITLLQFYRLGNWGSERLNCQVCNKVKPWSESQSGQYYPWVQNSVQNSRDQKKKMKPSIPSKTLTTHFYVQSAHMNHSTYVSIDTKLKKIVNY